MHAHVNVSADADANVNVNSCVIRHASDMVYAKRGTSRITRRT